MLKFIMMVGLPGSGKSTWALRNSDLYDVLLSSDDIREEITKEFGSRKEENKWVFDQMRKRTLSSLKEGKSVCYDATNLSEKDRGGILKELSRIKNVEKICIVMCTPIEECLERNSRRERKVPEEVIRRYTHRYVMPMYKEGFDKIVLVTYELESLEVIVRKDFSEDDRKEFKLLY